MTDLTPEIDAFVHPSDATLQRHIARTIGFLDEQGPGSWLRRAHASRYPRRLVDLEECEMRGVPPAQAKALEEIGFRPLGVTEVQIGANKIYVERWSGPDGALVMETSDRGKQYFIVTFENGRKLAMNVADPIGRLSTLMQLEHEYLRQSGDLAADYYRTVAATLEYAAKHETRPLYRGTDAELDQRLWDYYDAHVASYGFIIGSRLLRFAIGGVFLGVYLVLKQLTPG